MVLLDASSEPEVGVYDRLHAGPWIDGTVHPAPCQQVFRSVPIAECLRRGQLAHQQT
jgi:hypothetical protein